MRWDHASLGLLSASEFAPAADEGYFLGLIEIVRTNRAEAIRWLKRYLELAPRSPYAASARSLLADAERIVPPPPEKPAKKERPPTKR